jgi:hypothetical protein
VVRGRGIDDSSKNQYQPLILLASTLNNPESGVFDLRLHDAMLGAVLIAYLLSPPGMYVCVATRRTWCSRIWDTRHVLCDAWTALHLLRTVLTGVLQWAVDQLFLAPLWHFSNKTDIGPEDIVLEKKLGEGGFGTAWRAELADPDSGKKEPVIVKQVCRHRLSCCHGSARATWPEPAGNRLRFLCMAVLLRILCMAEPAGNRRRFLCMAFKQRPNALLGVPNGAKCVPFIPAMGSAEHGSRTCNAYRSFCLQVKEYGEAETFMNERIMRVAPNHFARFISAFEAKPTDQKVLAMACLGAE